MTYVYLNKGLLSPTGFLWTRVIGIYLVIGISNEKYSVLVYSNDGELAVADAFSTILRTKKD